MSQRENAIEQQLPFSSDALYPAFCSGTLEVHHGQIFRAHQDALTILRASYPEIASLSARELLMRRNLPRRDAEGILWHAGAVYAHGLYFSSLAPPSGGYPQPKGELSLMLSRDIGSLGELVYRLCEAASSMRGVGFLYLLRDAGGRLAIRSLRDYDCPSLHRERPLFCIDLWEHAYFSDHGARPEKAVDAFLSVLCWDTVEKRAIS
jgi:Fe-Mn family superoxide dismutase